MSDDITHDLDLLDDWLAGKGYGEEAGLVLRALSLIHKLQDGVRSTIQERDVLSGENFDLRAENERLRAALAFYADKDTWRSSTSYMCGHIGETRASMDRGEKARAAVSALKETVMSDIVERLKSQDELYVQKYVGTYDIDEDKIEPLCEEAADEILRLRAEVEKQHEYMLTMTAERNSLSDAVVFLRTENAKLHGLLREAWVKMDANNLWSNLRARAAAALKETGDE